MHADLCTVSKYCPVVEECKDLKNLRELYLRVSSLVLHVRSLQANILQGMEINKQILNYTININLLDIYITWLQSSIIYNLNWLLPKIPFCHFHSQSSCDCQVHVETRAVVCRLFRKPVNLLQKTVGYLLTIIQSSDLYFLSILPFCLN